MENILTIDWICKRERENCRQEHKWTLIVKTCLFKQSHYLFTWAMARESTVKTPYHKRIRLCMHRPVLDKCHELMICWSVFLKFRNRASRGGTGRCEERIVHFKQVVSLVSVRWLFFWGFNGVQIQNCKCVCCQQSRHLKLVQELRSFFLCHSLSVVEFSLARAPSCHK